MKNNLKIKATFVMAAGLLFGLGTRLWQVNVNTGNYTQIGPSHWNDVKGMVGIAGKLYIVEGSKLYEADENGNRLTLGGGWGLTKSIGIIRNGNIL